MNWAAQAAYNAEAATPAPAEAPAAPVEEPKPAPKAEPAPAKNNNKKKSPSPPKETKPGPKGNGVVIPKDNRNIYCRSWCPLHPKVNPIVFALIDELIDGDRGEEQSQMGDREGEIAHGPLLENGRIGLGHELHGIICAKTRRLNMDIHQWN